MDRTSNIPSVTIALLTYNHADVLAGSLKCLMEQNYANFEVLVQDDGSSDETISIAKRISKGNSRIRVARTPRNLGGWGNLALAIENCSSDFICWACPGDFWEKEFISVLVGRLQSKPGAVAAMCGTIDFDERTRLECGRRSMTGPESPEALNWFNLACATLMKTRPRQEGRPHYSLILHGLIDKKIMWDALRSFQGTGPVINERSVLAFLALVGPIVVSDRWLFKKERHALPALVRGPHVASRRARSNPKFLYTRITYQTMRAMFRASTISRFRKCAVPVVVGQYFLRSVAENVMKESITMIARWLPAPVYNSIRRFYRHIVLDRG